MKGRTGPPPKTRALRILEGDRGKQAKYTIPIPEPAPAGSTAPPDDLTDPERAIWAQVVPYIAPGLIAACDIHELAKSCRLEAQGDTSWDEKDFKLALRCWAAASAIWYRFGITPAERSRIRAPEQPKENKWASVGL